MSAPTRTRSAPRLTATHAATPPPENRLLETLAVVSPGDAAWLAPQLESVTLELGEVLAAATEPFVHVYFPETAVVSIINHMSDGGAVEVGTIGNEGMVGIASFLDADPGQNETVVQIPGTARRAPSSAVADGAHGHPTLRRLLSRYTQAYLTQVAQTAACNRLHGIEERCARWLLMTHDRVGRAETFPLTQEYLAIMLGVRRAGVTLAAGALRDAGLIRYSRGSVHVVDREGLEAASCECYGIVRRHFDRLTA